MKPVLVSAVCIAALLAAAGVSQSCRTVQSVVGGVAVWNHDRAIVIINSKRLTYRGSVLEVLFGRVKQTAGIPSEPSDGAYHVTSSASAGVWTYRVLERRLSAVIASVDENPRWSCGR